MNQERQYLLDKLMEDYTPEVLEKNFKPGSMGCHELFDRVSILITQLESLVVEHPSCINKEEWFDLAITASVALNELYMSISSEHTRCAIS